jgi:PP-loop superfamily ATP-utilizing enzyme
MGETIIKQLTGFQLIRVRDLDGVAKIEVESSNIPILYEKNYLEQIVNKLQMIGFTSVTVDPNGYRSGNLNIIYEK